MLSSVFMWVPPHTCVVDNRRHHGNIPYKSRKTPSFEVWESKELAKTRLEKPRFIKMWKMMTLSFLICIFKATLIRVQVAADAAACAACTAAYNPTSDKECLDLKKYLNCLETAAGTTDWCTLSTEEAQNVAKATCSTPLKAPCTCLKDFWGSECRSLEHYTQCLNTASDAACENGLKASELVTRADGRSDPKCGTATSTTTTTTKGSGASPLRMYSAIASFLPFVHTAFRL